jgi:hypothetical protein
MEYQSMVSNIKPYWQKYKKYVFIWLAIHALAFGTIMATVLINPKFSFQEYNQRTMRDNPISCNDSAQCGNGECIPSPYYGQTGGVCQCDNFYINHDGGICNYKMLPKLNVFMASFFGGGVGADWFYMARGNGGYDCAGFFKLITIGGLTIWWDVDWIRVICNDFPDGHGVVPTVWT